MDVSGSDRSPQAAGDALRMLATTLDLNGVVAGARRIDIQDEMWLHESERDQIAGASDIRRREFASGRTLMRDLLDDDVPLPIGDDRRPVLPPGVCASIAHDRVLVVGVLTRSHSVASLGVDIEPVQVLEPNEQALVLRDDEAGLDAGLAFCLKEAAFKAWRSLDGRMLDPHDLRVTVDGARFRALVIDAGNELSGAWAIVQGAWIALATAS